MRETIEHAATAFVVLVLAVDVLVMSFAFVLLVALAAAEMVKLNVGKVPMMRLFAKSLCSKNQPFASMGGADCLGFARDFPTQGIGLWLVVLSCA